MVALAFFRGTMQRQENNMAASPSSEWEDAPCVKSCPRAHLLSCLQTRGSAPTLLSTIRNKNCFSQGGQQTGLRTFCASGSEINGASKTTELLVTG